MEIGILLKRKRIEQKLNTVQLSKSSGVSQSTISDIEAGNRSPTVNTLEKLCMALNISLQEIFPYSQESFLSEDESELLTIYRKLSGQEKEHFLKLFKLILEKR
ncbi:hypothetical protein BSK66_27725 [Paenibacillus odorifer]|uniref:helix-turn-helix transcriptional regulator n=1 Tax=Paenibacillus TaxID=44249 RepID=UPI0003E2972D|nr:MULTISPECIES: helix-turn-helix transcriptional regulator [Paenibacillus]ETT61287.1 XRE family transcriptional regulator [Paenibacillus sp. FSL H8-237]OMD13747.1 hypothetical protein BJP47_24275 [Paenibacillus odorifer]OME48977.1 hypothetical protein BSK66_27725 [Paenibacillus odorifer]